MIQYLITQEEFERKMSYLPKAPIDFQWESLSMSVRLRVKSNFSLNQDWVDLPETLIRQIDFLWASNRWNPSVVIIVEG